MWVVIRRSRGHDGREIPAVVAVFREIRPALEYVAESPESMLVVPAPLDPLPSPPPPFDG